MATPKKKQNSKLKDPFKVRQTKTEATKESDTITPPEHISLAIDKFRQCQDQAKHFEGEATVYKDTVHNWALEEYVKRTRSGLPKSFKLLGDEAMATFVVMDSSAGLTQEDIAMISDRFGEDVTDALVERDFRSIRFDPKVLEANYDAVVEALSSLDDSILESLFKPMLMKAKPGAVEKAKALVKEESDFRELLVALKMKNYIR